VQPDAVTEAEVRDLPLQLRAQLALADDHEPEVPARREPRDGFDEQRSPFAGRSAHAADDEVIVAHPHAGTPGPSPAATWDR
jgi:hypothetical protein